MFSQIKKQRAFTHRNLNRVGSKTSVSLPNPKNVSKDGIELVPLSKKRKRYAIEYQNQRIGIIKPGIDCWRAIADLQYGASESKLDSPMLGVYWLVDNYERVKAAGITFLLAKT